jgi:hypothetical protein
MSFGPTDIPLGVRRREAHSALPQIPKSTQLRSDSFPGRKPISRAAIVSSRACTSLSRIWASSGRSREPEPDETRICVLRVWNTSRSDGTIYFSSACTCNQLEKTPPEALWPTGQSFVCASRQRCQQSGRFPVPLGLPESYAGVGVSVVLRKNIIRPHAAISSSQYSWCSPPRTSLILIRQADFLRSTSLRIS